MNTGHLIYPEGNKDACQKGQHVVFFPFIICVLHFFTVVLQNSTALKNTFSDLKSHIHKFTVTHQTFI